MPWKVHKLNADKNDRFRIYFARFWGKYGKRYKILCKAGQLEEGIHNSLLYDIIIWYKIEFLVDRARRDINRNRDELRRVEGDIRKEENQRLRLKDDLASAKRHLDKVLQEIRSLEMSSRNYQDFGRKHFTNIYGLTQTEFFSELLCDMDRWCGKVRFYRDRGYR